MSREEKGPTVEERYILQGAHMVGLEGRVCLLVPRSFSSLHTAYSQFARLRWGSFLKTNFFKKKKKKDEAK